MATLPPYSHDAPLDQPPPPYIFPSRFTIGHETTYGPLVPLEAVKSHLLISGEFAELKDRVEILDVSNILSVEVPKEKERRWAWFVGLAVERYSFHQRLPHVKP